MFILCIQHFFSLFQTADKGAELFEGSESQSYGYGYGTKVRR
jgi:hypothetical protein